MTPDFGTRLDNCIKALEHVVIPAVDAGDPLACEQAALVCGHLRVLRGQADYVADYEAQCLTDLLELARALASAPSSGPVTLAAQHALQDAIGAATERTSYPSFLTPARRNALATAIDGLVRASSVDADAGFLDESQRLILAHGARQSTRDRAWFAASGLDPDSAELLSIRELVGA